MTVSKSASLLTLLILLLAVTGVHSLGWLLAELKVAQVRSSLALWSEQTQVSSLAAWQQTLDQLEQAIRLNSQSADYYQLQALLQEWRGFAVGGEEITFEDLLTSRRHAVAAYRQSVRLQPSQATGWAHLARMKLQAGEADAEFKQALRLAIAYGRDIEEVNFEVSYIASLGWLTIAADAELQKEVKGALVRSLQSQRAAASLAFLREGELLPELCPEFDFSSLPENVEQACKE